MHQTFVVVNDKSFGFANPKEAFTALKSMHSEWRIARLIRYVTTPPAKADGFYAETKLFSPRAKMFMEAL